MKRVLLWILAAGVVGALVLLIHSSRDHATQSPPPASTPPAEPLAPTQVTVTASMDLSAEHIQAIDRQAAENPAFRNDLLFLVVASARDRCVPDHKGDLAHMATRARLPVLVGISQLTQARPELDAPLYRWIVQAAQKIDCGRGFVVAHLPPLDIERYAQRFPDSYFTPFPVTGAPREYDGRSLQSRARSGCQTLAYTVLPLSTPNWHCDAIRAQARRRVVTTCEQAQRGSSSATDTELTAELGVALASPVNAIVASVPMNCR